jgi:hypothetical protein
MADFGRLSLDKYKSGNGSKVFGAEVFFNSNRIGFQGDFWTWSFYVTWDFK